MTLIKSLTWGEETELLAAVFSSIAFYNNLARENESDYWKEKAERLEVIADKFKKEIQESIYDNNHNHDHDHDHDH